MNTKSLTILIIVLGAVFSLTMWMGSQSAPTDANAQLIDFNVNQNPRTITVNGDADIRVAPDEVIITLGVETWDLDLAVAKADNDERIRRVLALTKDLNIDPKHIQTEHISIEPRYESYYEKRDFVGYFVRKTVVITLKDLDKFEDLITATLEEGTTNVHGIQFRTSELRKHKDDARALAIRAAEEKASAMAGELDQDIGKPITITEYQSGWWSPYSSWWGSYWGGNVAQNVVQNLGGADFSDDGTIAPGQITVNARVTVMFELL